MAPKLYSILASPPVRAVLICAKALDLELEVVPVDLLEGEHLKDDFLKKNPQHTVPVLEDDGFIVSDSHAIMAYLVAKYGKDDSLYPKNDHKRRATIDHILHLDSGIVFVRGLLISKPLVFKGEQPTKEKFDELRDALQIVDQILSNNKTDYMAGNILSIADFSIFTTITSWNVFVPYTDFPNVTAYIKRMQKLPCCGENNEGLAMYTALIGSKLQK